MQKIKYGLILIFMCWQGLYLSAQDMHFTHFVSSPLTFNPALAGAFEGTLRLSGNFRSQWHGNDVNGYTTYDPTVDAPLPFMIKNRHWVGAGITILSDQSGIGNLLGGEQNSNLKLNQFRLNLAFHLSLDKKLTSIISIGGQYVTNGRSTRILNGATRPALGGIEDVDKELFAVGGNNSDPDAPDASRDFKNFIFGINYIKRSKTGELSIGLSTANLLNNNQAFKGQEDQPTRITAVASYKGIINKKYKFEPAIMFQTMSWGNEISAHSVMGFKLKPESDIWLKGGLGARTGTFSPQVLLGADWKSLSAMLSFDIPVSGVGNLDGFQNAFELGIVYQWTRNKVPQPDPIIYCPRL